MRRILPSTERHVMNFKLLVVLAALATTLVRIEAAKQGTIEEVQKRFHTAPGAKLTMDVNVGSIRVRTATADSVTVELYRRALVKDTQGVRDETKEEQLL